MSKYISELSLLRSQNARIRYESLRSLLHEIGVNDLDKDFMKSFIYDPASTKYHGSFEGGLIRHSASVALILMDWESKGIVNFNLERSPVVIGLLHDICKVGTYKRNENGGYTYDN